jgi:pimeloyl-ACP methyl ester carboxylesterase
MEPMATFSFRGWRIAFSEFPPRNSRRRYAPPLVVVHGLLLSQRLYWPLAKDLAAKGHRVITVDLLGHGDSDRPQDPSLYSISCLSEQLGALLDHLDLAEAALFGTSMGANVSLTYTVHNQERVRALVAEMPVLEGALVGGATLLTPVLLGLKYGGFAFDAASLGLRTVPRRLLPHYVDALLVALRDHPSERAVVLHGLFFGALGPTAAERATVEVPTLVIGHRFDPLHPFGDAKRLADELPNGRLIEACTPLELRLAPARLTGELNAFLKGAWSSPQQRPAPLPTP